MKEYNKIRFLAKASVVAAEAPVAEQEVDDAVDNTYVDTQPDLIRIQAVLVSTGINDNGHVFLSEELYPARNTATHKPMNLGHNDDSIIGHISNSHVETKTGEIIPEPDEEGRDSMPKDFDIISESVMYAQIFSDVAREIRERAQNGELFVSVEAWYSDYDYLVGNRIVKRNAVTEAYLDSILLMRGGIGEVEGEKVSMVLRDLIIAGVGLLLTETPANKRSEVRSVNSEKINVVAASETVDLQKILEDHTQGFIDQQEACMAGGKNKVEASASNDSKVDAKAKDAAAEVATKEEETTEVVETGEAEKGADESTEVVDKTEEQPAISEGDGEAEETSEVDEFAQFKSDMESKFSDMQKKIDERDAQLTTYQQELSNTQDALEELRKKTEEQPKAEDQPPAETVEEKPEEPVVVDEGTAAPEKDEEASEVTSDKETQEPAEAPSDDTETEVVSDTIEENVDDAAIEDAVDDALNNADKEDSVVDFTSDGENSLVDEFVEILDNLDIGFEKSVEDEEENNGS